MTGKRGKQKTPPEGGAFRTQAGSHGSFGLGRGKLKPQEASGKDGLVPFAAPCD